MTKQVVFWRRTDFEGLERMELVVRPSGVSASSIVLGLGAGGFRVEHRWELDHEWRAQRVTVERWNDDGHASLSLERAGTGWNLNGSGRADLEGAEEPDLSVTPFCNTFPIRRTPEGSGESLTLDIAYIDGVALTVARSRQRYDRQAEGSVRYVDLGIYAGFEADLAVDESGLVVHYDGLFERVYPEP